MSALNETSEGQSVSERLRYEYVALGMVGTHGTPSGGWYVDLTESDIAGIRDLLADAGFALDLAEDALELAQHANHRDWSPIEIEQAAGRALGAVREGRRRPALPAGESKP